ncbi:MAG: tape measure protein [bacterium]|nr:tape measure protein [bacterium]
MPVLKAGIDSRGAKVGANQFNSSLDSMKRKVRETGASMDRFGRDSYASLSLMKAGIMGVVASLTSMGVIMGAMRFAQFAMQVEAMRISMEAAAGGAEQARKELSFLRVEAGRLGLAFQDQVGAYKGLLAASRGTRLEGEKTRQIFLGIAEAGTALQLTTDEMNGILLATQQIMSKGKVQAEELRGQIGERLPGAFSVAAKAMNMTTAELDKFMSQGKLTAEDFLPKFAAALREHYSGALEKSTDSLRSNVNRMTTAWAAFKTAIVDVAGMEGTNTVLKKITSTIKELTEVVKENRGPIDNFISGFANSSKIIGGFAKDYSALGMTLKSIDLMKMAWDESFMTDIDRLRKGLKDVSDDILKLDTARQNAYKNMTQINKDAPGGILSPDDERRVKALYSQTQVLNKSILDLMNIKVKLNKLFEAETNVEKMTGDLAKLDDEIEHYIQLRKGSIDDIAKLKDAMAEGTAPHSSVGAPARQYQLLQQEVLDIERVLGVL